MLLAARPEQLPLLIPARSEAVRKLPNNCPTIVEQLLREPCFGASSVNNGRFRPVCGQCVAKRHIRPPLADSGAKFGRCWPNVGQLRPNLGLHRSMSVKLARSWPDLGQLWRHVGRHLPIVFELARSRPSAFELGPDLHPRSSCATTRRQPFGYFRATSKLAGIAKGAFSGRVESNKRSLQRRRHRKSASQPPNKKARKHRSKGRNRNSMSAQHGRHLLRARLGGRDWRGGTQS